MSGGVAPERLTVETDRLLLEPVTPLHSPGINSAVVDSRPELLPWMPWAREPTLDSTIEMIHRGVRVWAESQIFHFAVIERETGTVLGVAGITHEDQEAWLHYWIRTDHAGRGLTTEAAGALVGWARQELGLARLMLWAGRENHASRRVTEKLGFKHLGPLDWRPEGGQGEFDAESYELRFNR